MKTLLLTALAIGAIACAKDQPSKSDQTPAPAAAKTVDTKTVDTKTATADTAGAVSCDTPEMAADCGQKKEAEAGGCNKWDDEAAAVAKRDVPQNAAWTTLKVSGMTCGGCERRVIAHVGKLDNVVSVEADSELGQVRVAMASQNAETAQAAEAEIKRLGYRVE